jgi:hypothetical protein
MYTHLTSLQNSNSYELFFVDLQGRPCRLDLTHGRSGWMDDRAGRLLAGSAMTIVQTDPIQLVAIDRSGNLLSYVRQSETQWREPVRLANGFLPGTRVATAMIKRAQIGLTPRIAATDATGSLQTFRISNGRWLDEPFADLRLAPGTPVALLESELGLEVFAIDVGGRWCHWQRQRGRWSRQSVAEGFACGFPVGFCDAGRRGFAIDRRGRLVAARLTSTGWGCAICDPIYAFAPTLVSRGVVPNPPLAPVQIELVNGHDENLSVRLVSKQGGVRPAEIKLAAGQAARVQIQRDAGGVFEEVYLVPGPLGQMVEQVHRFPLPAQSLYDIVVYADRVTSVYFDRTQNRSDVPDSVQTSLVSTGVFPLPPGDHLQEGDQVDVYREAKYQQNPGAAVIYGRP